MNHKDNIIPGVMPTKDELNDSCKSKHSMGNTRKLKGMVYKAKPKKKTRKQLELGL